MSGKPIDLSGRHSDGRTRRARGIAHVPEDRQGEGLVMEFFAWENMVLGYHRAPEYRKSAVLMDRSGIRSETARKMAQFDVRPPNPALPARSFSGGNQQKLVLAREMTRDPELLLVGQPTRGVDIGAIEFIHRRLIEMRDAGKAILLVSAELEEILALADRIVVMHEGRIVGEMPTAEADRRKIGLLMAGITEDAA